MSKQTIHDHIFIALMILLHDCIGHAMLDCQQLPRETEGIVWPPTSFFLHCNCWQKRHSALMLMSTEEISSPLKMNCH
jgi:hypothetical protein